MGSTNPGVFTPSRNMLELAESLGLGVALQLWGPEGSLDSSTAHVELLDAQLATQVVRIDDVPVDVADTAALQAAAGALVAW